MKLAFIAPTAHLEDVSARGGILLALAHLIDDEGKNEYTRWHRRKADQGWRIILDNGLFEGSQPDHNTLLHRARLIGAQVVCAPDVLYDSGETIKSFKQFIRAKQDKGLVIDVMGIPQADNPTDWWDCFRFMDLSPDCNIIGLSILAIPKAFNAFLRTTGITAARMSVIQQLYRYEMLIGRRLTPCHLLGLGDSLADLTLATRLLPHTIISNDSSSAYIHGAREIHFNTLGTIVGGKDKTPVDFSSKLDWTEAQEEAIYHNIKVAYNLIEGVGVKYR